LTVQRLTHVVGDDSDVDACVSRLTSQEV
jgi:hypothetical protein